LSKSYIRKLGVNRGKPRLWLQGAVLVDAGFAPGDRYALLCRGVAMRLRRLRPGEDPHGAEHAKPRKVSGKGPLPIVDISGAVIPETFGADAVEVCCVPSRGVVVVSVESPGGAS